MQVKNGLAVEIVDDLKRIFAGYALSEKASAIRFEPFERQNLILVITPNPAVIPEVQKWLERLDQPIQTGGLQTFFYKAKYGRAADLQKVLSQLYTKGVPVPVAEAPAAEQPAAARPPAGPQIVPPPGPTPATTPPAVIGGGGAAANLEVVIIADEVNNALVIQATQQVFAEIQRVLLQLDVLRRQVLIDAQIYEVTLDNSISLGISAQLQNRGNLERSTTGSFVTPQGGSAPSLSAQTFAYIGRSRELLLFLNAEENRSRVRTLSAPSVLVSDNFPAEFQVGAEVPVPTTSSISPVQSDGTNVFAQTIQFRNTGVILKVKPQINEGGNVSLDIMQEVSQAAANNTSGIVAPVIGKSSVNSTVVIGNGQTIALGGFIRDNNEQGANRVPLIGRIPIIGYLFGNSRKAHTRSELIVLITPHVLESREDADRATEELKAKLKEVSKAMAK
jgi:general secretion pathway protein D